MKRREVEDIPFFCLPTQQSANLGTKSWFLFSSQTWKNEHHHLNVNLHTYHESLGQLFLTSPSDSCKLLSLFPRTLFTSSQQMISPQRRREMETFNAPPGNAPLLSSFTSILPSFSLVLECEVSLIMFNTNLVSCAFDPTPSTFSTGNLLSSALWIISSFS